MKMWILISWLALPLFGANDSLIPPELRELVQNIDAKAETIATIRAKFHFTQELEMMTENMEQRGTFFLKKPDGIKFSAVPEDDLIVVITPEESISLSPNAKKANRVHHKKRRDFITQKLLARKLEAMLGFFTITTSKPSTEVGVHRLELTPIKRKYKKKFEKIILWVNADHLVYKIHMHRKDGDLHRLELSDIEINVEIDSNEFATTIPEGYELGDRLDTFLGTGFGF